jgi:hypothetical protein
LKLWIPLLLTFGSTLIALIQNLLFSSSNIAGSRFRRVRHVFRKIVYVFDKVVLLLFTLVISAIFSFFDCTIVRPGEYVIRTQASIKCFDKKWYQELAQVTLFLLLYVIAFPLRLLWIFRRMQKDRKVMTDPNYQHIIRGFKKRYYWWDMVNVLKRLLFVFGSQFLFSGLNTATRLLLSTLILYFFFALDAYIEPYQFGKVSKNNWNFLLVLVLLCQALIFERDEASNDIFVYFVFMMFVLCGSQTVFSMAMFIKRRKMYASINKTALRSLGEEITEQLFQIYSESQLRNEGELLIELQEFAKRQNTQMSIMELWQIRRHCDILHDAGKMTQLR